MSERREQEKLSLHGQNLTLRSRISELEARVKVLAGALAEYGGHNWRCILSYQEAGEPTEDGGYRTMYKGKWYQSRPVDETPKCECGLDEALAPSKGEAND